MSKTKKGFTLAEVLITLTIIGIVAAITLPSLLVNVNEKAWNAQKKALYARMSQAIGEMESVGGYGSSNDETDEQIKDGAAESFIIDGLSKVYRIQNVCNSNNLTACGIPSSIITLNKNVINFPTTLNELNSYFTKYPNDRGEEDYTLTLDTKAAGFETVNGESIAVFYNPSCGSNVTNTWSYVQTKVCANMIYDLNGLKGPNEVGKDVGVITVFFRTNSVVVAPNPLPSNASTSTAPSYSENGKDAATICAQQGDDVRLPDIDELGSMSINYNVLGMQSGYYWSGSVISSGKDGLAWRQGMSVGSRNRIKRTESNYIRCVKR